MVKRRVIEALEDIGFFNIPINQDELFKAVIAAETRGLIKTEFRRIVVFIPLGATVTNIIETPEGSVLKHIGYDRIMPDFHDQLLTVSLTIDGIFEIYDNVPLTRDTEVDSVFFPFIFDRIEHEISNFGANDIQFTNDAQLLNIDKAFFDEIFAPIFNGQYQALREFAERVID